MILCGLAVFAGLSVNLILEFALGADQAGKGKGLPVSQIFCLFVSVLFLWTIYRYVLIFFPWEFVVFLLFFPLSVLVCLGFETLEKRFFPNTERDRSFSALTAYEGLIPASLFLTVNLASTFLDALVLSLFFALGCFMAIFILREITRRSSLEEIPHWLRGPPLTLISMGLLSMIFSSAAWICYKILDNF